MSAATVDADSDFAQAQAAHRAGRASAGEVACAFVVELLRARSGSRFLQGLRIPPLACEARHPSAKLIAQRRLKCLPEGPARALVGWASERRPGVLLGAVPSPRDVLSLQARGLRCVSLLDASATADPLAFALHDLEHLEKFADPLQHEAQVGFFKSLERAIDHPRFADVERGLDERWTIDRDHVLADMNGSAAFLFVALKSRAKLAVMRRRGLPREHDDADARRDWACALEALLDAFQFTGIERLAASAFESKRDDPKDALLVVEAFRRRAHPSDQDLRG